ncbi:MAG: M23 family metallopeptidase [Acidobacteriota bacterium]
MRRWLRRAGFPLSVLLLLTNVPDAAAMMAQYCYGYQTSTTTCNDSGCEMTVEWHQACYWWDDGRGGGYTPPPDPNGDPYPGSRYGDYNDNGVMDDWTDVVETSDPCAFNLDYGDRLGSDYGGPNETSRAPAGETGRSSHNGVDIQGNLGDAIHSIRNGYVERAGDDGTGCGYSIRIRHDDNSTATYCHMTLGSVPTEFRTVDARVRGGAQVGQVGDTGSPSAGAYHLHLIYHDPQGNVREYFNGGVETGPASDQLNFQGC